MNVSETRKLIEYLISSGNLTDDTFLSALKLMGHRIPRKSYYEPVPKKEVDVSSVNWNETNNTISIRLGISAIRVSELRRTLGRKKLCYARYSHIPWRDLDWSKNDSQISREFGISPQTIRRIRIELGKPIANKTSAQTVTPDMIESVDWVNNHDFHLAKQWGVSRERVRQIRNEKQLPKCMLNTHNPRAMEVEKWLIENESAISGKIASEVAKLCPVDLNKSGKISVMRKSKIPFVFRNFREHYSMTMPINWELPNKFIDAIWNRCINWSASTRNRFDIPKSPHRHKPYADTLMMFDMKILNPLISKEIEKANRLGIKTNMQRLEGFGYRPSKIQNNYEKAATV